MTHPKVLTKMRKYAIKQALTELPDEPTQADFVNVARDHMLSYGELKQAYTRSRNERA